MPSLIKKVIDTWKYEGAMAVLKKTKKYVFGKRLGSARQSFAKGTPIYDQYKFVLGRVRRGGEIDGEPKPKTVNWVVPDLGAPGAGGHLTIFRCIKYLEEHGCHNRIYFHNVMGGDTKEAVKNIYERHYKNVAGDDAEIFSVHTEKMEPAEAVFATSWQTAYYVRDIKNCRRKFYFVQDFEPCFFPQGSEYFFAENTYKWGFVGIAASPWLKGRLEKGYGMKCYDFGFSFNKDIYYPRDVERKKNQVLFYARPSTARRAFELAMLAFEIVSEKMPDVHFVFVGGGIKGNYDLPFDYEDAGIVSPDKLPDYYSSSRICVALSGSNVSLMPLEVMGCKSVLLSNDDEQVRWLVNEHNAILAHMDPMDIAEKICYYLTHPSELEKIREAGYEYAQKTSWDDEYGKVLKALEKELGQ
ncbi:MAG: glycosyltransferase family 4 protein [Schwartzia sp.]|nr:glycosyltransferase family 4 protein [Schwartzia sp. (in: firmicutes)]